MFHLDCLIAMNVLSREGRVGVMKLWNTNDLRIPVLMVKDVLRRRGLMWRGVCRIRNLRQNPSRLWFIWIYCDNGRQKRAATIRRWR